MAGIDTDEYKRWRVRELMGAGISMRDAIVLAEDEVRRGPEGMGYPEHRRYDSDEFDYSGCVVCDWDGNTLGWPCPTVKARA